MKTLIVVCVVLLSSVASPAQKTRAGQGPLTDVQPGVGYPLSVHVYGVHLREDCSVGCSLFLFADVVASGRKVELDCPRELKKKREISLSLGDFHARTLKGATGFEMGDQYELVIPDSQGDRVLRCTVSGMME